MALLMVGWGGGGVGVTKATLRNKSSYQNQSCANSGTVAFFELKC